jgi:hypothetical protein
MGEEDRTVISPRESQMAVALHETIHIVILRLDGTDVADVIDQDDAAWTRLVEPHKFTVAALMAPEVYMNLNNIDLVMCLFRAIEMRLQHVFVPKVSKTFEEQIESPWR